MTALDPGRRYFSAEIETRPCAELERRRDEILLGDLLPWAYERAPLIRETWDAAGVRPDDLTSMDDVRARVPFIDKDAIRAYRDRHDDPYGGLLCLDPNDASLKKVFSAIFSTSGTTGDPTPAPYAGKGPSFLVREFWELGCRPGDHFMHCLFTFRGPNIHDTIRGIGATPVFVDHQPEDVPQLFRFSRELRPTGWYTLSGPLVMMIEAAAAELGEDLEETFRSYSGVVFAGEPIGPRARRRVESWGLELFLQTALGDVGAATECAEHDGCHFWEDTAFIECLDPEGTTAVGDGQRGELVSTTLLDKVAPLVRYRSDDIVRVTTAPCRCGRTHGRVWPLGRKGDEVVVDGVSVLPGDVWAAVERVDETSAGLFQVIRPRREVDTLRLRVGYATAGARDLGQVRTQVTDAVHEAVGVRPDIELVEHDVLLRQGPPHKIPRVASA
ncbi:MAG TPA: phenylacetate--CoA ligase family protein [Acidimicrobiia bacterium]|nr:phenylacetate--CoA ligase family protein [Acidimicrobiia bacterium]